MLPADAGDLFRAAALLTPDATALIDAGDGDRRFTYVQLDERCDAVAAACVVPAPHPTKGQAPVAYVVPRDGLQIEEPTLKHFCLEHGPAYAHPCRVYLLDALPLTSIGKADRAELARRVAASR